MPKKVSSLVAWLAALNALLSVYILWTYYRALQYMPATGGPPLQLKVILWVLLLFEVVSFIVSAVYLHRKSVALVNIVYGVTVLQLFAVGITPFLIAASVIPRV